MTRDKLRTQIANQQGEIDCQLLCLPGSILRIQFPTKIAALDMTAPQALKLGQLLIDNASRLVQ